MASSDSLESLLRALEPDPWRAEVGFSGDVEIASQELWSAASDTSRAAALGGWLQKHQPCLFGRIAAKAGAIHYCFLTEDDLAGPEADLRAKIQAARTEWKRRAIAGEASGFVIAVVSPRIATALPNGAMKEVGRRIAGHYLLKPIEDGEIYTDTVRLELPIDERRTWEWEVGSNYFCAQGDKRWWHDHRIPGGMALSMNSVGHMVKANVIAAALGKLGDELNLELSGIDLNTVDSLPKALTLAMHTILKAAETGSGKATELLPLPADGSGLPRCPVDLPPNLAGLNHCEYRGYYHTDQTLPVEYFEPATTRPDDAVTYSLDFTYLFDDSLDNPDHDTMGRGLPVRLVGGSLGASEPSRLRLAPRTDARGKRRKSQGRSVGGSSGRASES